MRILLRGLHWFNMFLVWVAKLCLLGMVCIVTTVVFMRYLLNTGIAWSEEIPLLLVIWFTMIAMAIGVKLKLHISMDVLPSGLSPTTEKVLQKISDLVIMGVAVVMIYYGAKLAWVTRRGTLPGCGLKTYWLYLPVPFSGVMIFFDSLLNFFGIDKKDKDFAAQAEGIAIEKLEEK